MPVTAKSGPPRRPVRPASKPRSGMSRARREIAQSLGPALLVTLLFHLALFKIIPASGFFASIPASTKIAESPPRPLRVNTDPADKPIPANLLPPQMRPEPPKFVEVNPMAPTAIPDNKRNTGAADQRAAQPDPDKLSVGERPKVNGTMPDSTRIVQAIPREFIPKDLRPAAGQPVGAAAPDAPTRQAEAAKPAEAAKKTDGPAPPAALPDGKPLVETGRAFTEKPGESKPDKADKGVEKTDAPSPEKRDGNQDGKTDSKTTETADAKKPAEKGAPSKETTPPSGRDAPPRPRPKATIAGTTGPLGSSVSSVSEKGVIGNDSVFSRMGEYTSRLYEIIQAGWWAGIERSKINERGTVIIKFTLHKDGTVTDAKIQEYRGASYRAALLCLDAVVGRAPFDEWPPDMVGVYGDKQEGTLTFHYL